MTELTVYAWKPSTTIGTYLVGSGSYVTARANIDYVSANTDRYRFGQYYDGSYHLNESFVRFDTSALPDDATITDVKIHFYAAFTNYFDNLDIPMELRVYQRTWYGNGLTSTDGVDGGSLSALTKVAHYHITDGGSQWGDGYHAFESTAGELTNFIAAISKTGYSEFLCAYDWLENGHQRTGYNFGDAYSANNATQAHRPKLVITYTTAQPIPVTVDSDLISLSVSTEVEVATTTPNIDVAFEALTHTTIFETVTVTTTRSVYATVDTLPVEVNFLGCWLKDTGDKDIDGFLVHIHRGDNDNSPYVFGTEPEMEDTRVVPYKYGISDYTLKLDGLRRDTDYHFKIEAYRQVDQDIAASGIILSAGTEQVPYDRYSLDLSNVAAFTGPFNPSSNHTEVPADLAGLYGNYEHYGYVDHTVWKSYFDNQGRFYLIGGSEGSSLTWADDKLTLSVGDEGGLVLNGGSIHTIEKPSFDDTTPGFWMGTDTDGHYKFWFGGNVLDEFGETAVNFLSWDGTQLRVQGNLKGSSFETLNSSTIISSTEGIKITITGRGYGTEESLDFYYSDGTRIGSFYAMDIGEMVPQEGETVKKPLRIHATEEIDLTSYGHIYAWARGQMYFGSAGQAEGGYGDINFDAARNIVMGFGNEAGDYW
jgi:hypothetical protein